MTTQKDHLSLRGNTWHARLDIPADVRPHFGHRRVLSESLKTGDKRLARERGALLVAQWKSDIRAARGEKADLRDTWAPDIVRGVGNFETIMDALLLKVARRQIPDLVEQLVLGGLDSVASEWQADDRSRIYRHLKQLVNAKGFDDLEKFLRPFADDDNPDPVARFDALRFFLRRTLPDLWTQKYNLDASEHLEAQALVSKPESYQPKSPISSSLLNRFSDHIHTQNKASTASIYVLRIKKFSEWLTANGETITFDSVSAFLNSVSAKALTRKGYLSPLQRFHKWALKYDSYYKTLFPDGSNPFADHEHAKVGRAAGEEWLIFTKEQTTKLHAAALAKGDVDLADLITFACYTGCRIAELGRLRASTTNLDDHGNPISFNVDDSKTSAGIREIPIHSDLQPLYLKRLKSPHAPDSFLFPGADGPRTRLRINALSERFTKLKKSLNFGPEHVFHSLRKTFTTELQQAKADPLVIPYLLGHEVGHISFDVYSAGPSLEQKKEAIEKLKFNLQPHQ